MNLRLFFCVGISLSVGCSLFVTGKKSEERGKTKPPVSVMKDPYYHYMLSKLYSYEGRYSDAEEEYKKAIALDPISKDLKLELALVLLRAGKISEAKEILKRVEQAEEYIPEVHALLGRIYSVTREYDSAIKEFEESIRQNPDNTDLYLDLGTAYAEAGNPEKAGETFRRLLEIIPDFYLAYYYLAKIELMKGAPDSAIMYYKKSVTSNPDFLGAWLELGEIYEQKEMINSAIDAYTNAMKLAPQNISLHEKIGYLHATKNNATEAIKHFRDALSLDSTNLDLHLKLGIMYLSEKEYNKALDEFHYILLSEPNSQVATYYLGIVYIEMGEFEKGREELLKITPDSKLYLDSVIRIAFSYNREKRKKDAIEYLKAKLEEGTKSIELYRIIIAFLTEERLFDEAIKTANDGINDFPDSEDIYFQLGIVYDEMDEIDRALEQMQRVIKINPDNPFALNYIGYTWADRGINIDEAEKMIRKALKAKPDDGFIMDSLAWVHYQKGQFKIALKELHKALNLAGNDPIILEHIGDTYLKLGMPEKALDAYNKALVLKMKEKDKKRITEKAQKLRRRIH